MPYHEIDHIAYWRQLSYSYIFESVSKYKRINNGRINRTICKTKLQQGMNLINHSRLSIYAN